MPPTRHFAQSKVEQAKKNNFVSFILNMESNEHYMVAWMDYGNGGSGIRRYALGEDFIWLDFGSSDVYLFNYEATGKDPVEQMKMFATIGMKLTTFLNVSGVKNRYAKKVDRSKVH
jgi:hypothetical protein